MKALEEPIAMAFATVAEGFVAEIEPEYTYDEVRQTSTIVDGLTSSCIRSTSATNKQEADHHMDD